MVALEFALLAVPLTTFLFGLIALGTHYFLQQSLDYAIADAARKVEIGEVGSGYTQSDFVSKLVCPAFSGSCGGLFVDLHPVADYASLASASDAPDSASTQGLQFCPGSPGQTMYLHVILQAAMPFANLLGENNGYDVIISNAAFINENPAGKTVSLVGGCS